MEFFLLNVFLSIVVEIIALFIFLMKCDIKWSYQFNTDMVANCKYISATFLSPFLSYKKEILYEALSPLYLINGYLLNVERNGTIHISFADFRWWDIIYEIKINLRISSRIQITKWIHNNLTNFISRNNVDQDKNAQ